MSTILITGAGLIGSLTARLLAERGEAVVLLDKQPHHEAVRAVVGDLQVDLVQDDVTDFDLRGHQVFR